MLLLHVTHVDLLTTINVDLQVLLLLGVTLLDSLYSSSKVVAAAVETVVEVFACDK